VFDVSGEPVAQGSLRAFVRDGRPVVTYGPRAVALGTWRGLVAAAALEALGERPMATGPVVVRLAFRLRRPTTHYGARGLLPRYADHYPGTDLDKLARAVLDAVSGIAYRDDRQVVALVARKGYADRPGVSVHVHVTQPTGGPFA
jgi:crossover junction endodeoxyribonuclease RusA